MTNKPIIVIGAGMCGVSTAIWLQRLGREVILMDKGMPGMGASYGNSGLLAQWAVDPVTSPSLWWEAPRYLIQKNSPLFMKWGYLPKMLPWLKSAPCRRKPTHDGFKCCPQSTRPRVKGAPSNSRQRRPQREVSGMM